MPAAMNLQPLKGGMISGVAGHCFRDYDAEQIPSHIDAQRSHLNRVLHGDRHALDDLPTHQPDTGRKIRKDANRVASVICTLPKELDPDRATDVDAWVKATMTWLKKACPGTLAWAVLHQDETRPHIHAAVIPEDKRQHLSWHAHFHGRQVLRDLQASYAQALRPLGVRSHTKREKAVRKAGYTKGLNGWRAGRAVLDAQKRVQEVERQIREREQELQTVHPELEKATIARPGFFTRKEAYWAELEKHWAGLQQLTTARGGQIDRLTNKLQAREKTITQLTEDINHLTGMLLEQAPDKERVPIARKLRAMGIQTRPVQRILNQEYLRQWEKDQDRSRGIGL